MDKRILVVGRGVAVRGALAHCLADFYTVQSVGSVAGLTEDMARRTPSVAIFCASRGDDTAADELRELRRLVGNKPALLMVADELTPDLGEACYETAVYDCILEPYLLNDLVGSIRGAVRLSYQQGSWQEARGLNHARHYGFANGYGIGRPVVSGLV